MFFFMAMSGQGLVRPWLAFEMTDSKLALGLVSAAVAIPMLVLAPFGGVLADRMERRGLIMSAQTLAITSELLTLILLLTDQLEFWHLVVTAGMMGCAFPLIMPARQAIVVNIVGKKGLGAAVGLNMSGVNVTRVLGPAVQDFWMMQGGRDAWAERRMELLLEGYESLSDFPRGSLKLIEPLRAMRMVHFAAWLASRWEDPAFPPAFPDCGTPAWWERDANDLIAQLNVIREDLSSGGPLLSGTRS